MYFYIVCVCGCVYVCVLHVIVGVEVKRPTEERYIDNTLPRSHTKHTHTYTTRTRAVRRNGKTVAAAEEATGVR